MTHADNSSFLARANAQRHQAALSAARHAIEQLQRQGKPVSFSAIAQSAGVSRGWLYRQDQIRDIIGRLSAKLDRPVISNIVGIDKDGDPLVTQHAIFGGPR